MFSKVLLFCFCAYAASQVAVEDTVQFRLKVGCGELCGARFSTYMYQLYTQPAQPYSFAYDNTDEFGTRLAREESGDANNNKVGSYSYTDAAGVFRTVKYVADADGFHATVETNEPGTKSSNPADAPVVSSAVEGPHPVALKTTQVVVKAVRPAAAVAHVLRPAPVTVQAVHAAPYVVKAFQPAPLTVDPVHAVPVVHAFQGAPAAYSVGHAPVGYAVGHAPAGYAVGQAPVGYALGHGPVAYAVGQAPLTYTLGQVKRA